VAGTVDAAHESEDSTEQGRVNGWSRRDLLWGTGIAAWMAFLAAAAIFDWDAAVDITLNLGMLATILALLYSRMKRRPPTAYVYLINLPPLTYRCPTCHLPVDLIMCDTRRTGAEAITAQPCGHPHADVRTIPDTP
jgi:hypothetical protein